MDQGLKERLVGAGVLVLLAVVFVPMVLDGPEAPPAEAPATIAPVASGQSTFRYDLGAPLPGDATVSAAAAPATAAATTVAPRVAPTAAPQAPSKSAPTVATAPAAVAPKPTAKPAVAVEKPAQQAVATGWAAQVGSFSKEATAQGVAADLKSKGFKSFVMPHRDGKATLYRVRVGPVATRDAADALAKKITAKTGQAARPVQHP